MGVSAVFSPLRAYIHSFIWSYIICGKTSNATSGRVLQSCGFWASRRLGPHRLGGFGLPPEAVNEAGEAEQLGREENPALFLARVLLTTSKLAH